MKQTVYIFSFVTEQTVYYAKTFYFKKNQYMLTKKKPVYTIYITFCIYNFLFSAQE